MKNRVNIFNTDLNIFPVVLGTVSAGLSYDEESALKIINNYIGLGGNAIDTARIYSDWVPGEIGRSERIVGEVLKKNGRRNDICLITKGGHPKPDMMSVMRMKPEDMRYDLELSLKALQTDVIDIYLYHRDDLNQPVEVSLQIMEDFVQEGKIRYYGCSNWNAKRMKEAETIAKEKGYKGF